MRVSVLCPVFDTDPAMLIAAAESVLGEQTWSVAELILADDGSTADGTRDALATLARRPGARVLWADANGGPARARNRALAAATGDWIGFIDADDLWLPDHLAAVADVLAVAPGAAWVSANHDLLDAAGGRIPSALLRHGSGTRLGPMLTRFDPPASTEALIGNYWLHLGGCVVRADLARRVGGFDPRAVYSEDWLFFLRLSAGAPLYYVERSTYLLRRAHASFTTSSRRLTGARASGKRAALRTAALAGHRRSLRWALRGTYKELAANNLLLGRPARAAWFAARAFAMDPRAVGELARFGRSAWLAAGARRAALRRYTSAELMGCPLHHASHGPPPPLREGG